MVQSRVLSRDLVWLAREMLGGCKVVEFWVQRNAQNLLDIIPKPKSSFNFTKTFLLEYAHHLLEDLCSSKAKSNFQLLPLGMVVTIAEILKSNGLVVEKSIMTSMVDLSEEIGRPLQKPKIEIVLEKSAKFDELITAAQEEAVGIEH